MRILSALDATFVYLESEHSPMSIGAVYVIDAKDAPDGFSYDGWCALVKSRLALSNVFRQRLVEVPWDLSFPYWINDPDFELAAHLPKASLSKPAGMDELMQLAAEIWGKPLDRGRPLWDITFVEGLDGVQELSKGSFALVTRVHHAAVDGKASAEIMVALLDPTPEMRVVETQDDWQAEAMPSTLDVVSHSWSNAGKKAVDLAGFVGKAALDTINLQFDKNLKEIEPPPRLLSAPATIFNQPITSARTFWGRNFDFERIRKIKNSAHGSTVNDVVLAICAGGLRRYLGEKDELPSKPLVAMAPISVRGDVKGSGNEVSAMLVNLATDVEGSLNRLAHIHANTRRSKTHASALPANRITEFLPSETLAAAARVYTRTRMGGRHRPFFNVTITNVPGPTVPLYAAGARVHSAFGMAPVLDGLGLILVVLSYQGRLSIGINSCEQIVPDPEHMADCFSHALEDLELMISDTEPAKLLSLFPETAPEPPVRDDPLKPFHDASKALEEAIESLEKQK
jgi:WS/DGAT/MGAT family acyltransferase